ncbi:MAG: hypothetical protein LW636_03155 [Planctomycetaceae bacterium]|nr:hypothetical protein [Planctomycetaceae bacterium]
MRFHRCATFLIATFAIGSLASAVVADDSAPIDPGPLAPSGYPTPEQTADRLAELAKLVPGRASVARIAAARSGPAVSVLVLGNQDFSRRLPAMLVVAGMDGVNLGSTEQCLTAVERVLRDSPAVLDAARIYVIPEANPDARMHAITRREPRATNSRAVDDDRDGRVDEDGPTDLNGDGFVGTVWRVAPPGVKATHIVDPVDARIVRPANREKGEIATIEILREATDLDQDGLFGEDGRGGVDLDRNFPHRWPEFATDAGPFPLSERRSSTSPRTTGSTASSASCGRTRARSSDRAAATSRGRSSSGLRTTAASPPSPRTAGRAPNFPSHPKGPPSHRRRATTSRPPGCASRANLRRTGSRRGSPSRTPCGASARRAASCRSSASRPRSRRRATSARAPRRSLPRSPPRRRASRRANRASPCWPTASHASSSAW